MPKIKRKASDGSSVKDSKVRSTSVSCAAIRWSACAFELTLARNHEQISLKS